jgi:cell division protein FtsQ
VPQSRYAKKNKAQTKLRVYRFFQILLGTALIYGGIWGWNFINNPKNFPIKSVKVQATYHHLRPKMLEAVITPHINSGILKLNSTELKDSLRQLPWVGEVAIHRAWPDGLIIKIDEQQAMAKWGAQQLLNAQGKIFEPPLNTFPAGLPQFRGSEKHISELILNYQKMSHILKPLSLSIVEISANDRQSYSLVLNNGFKLWLGRTNPLQRLERFVKVYPKIIANPTKTPESIDLRYENGLAVQWKDNPAILQTSKSEQNNF